ncbi:MAG: hypothetical protein AB7F91_08130 [Parvularculaceae bacterium]|nr:hypothetical protein [Parvularculaceae bacterium]
MTTGQLLWAGLVCCIASLLVQLFPAAAYALGVDIAATWRLFGFGVFLIAIASLLAALSGRPGR